MTSSQPPHHRPGQQPGGSPTSSGYPAPGYPPQGYGYGSGQGVPPHQPPGYPQSGQQPSGQQPPRKRRRWPFVVGGIAVLLLIISVANGGNSNQPAPVAAAPSTDPGTTVTAPAPAVSAPVVQQPAQIQPAPAADTTDTDTITYEVTGKGRAGNITYIKDKNMGQEQIASAKMPWSKQVRFDGGFLAFQPLSLVAQNGSSGGEITCRILRNGQELTSSTSSGAYAVVTCAAS